VIGEWHAKRVPREEIEAERAKVEKTRSMLVGRWRVADQRDTQFTINADGTMSGTVNAVSGRWSLEEDVFTSGSGKRYRLLSSDATSVVLRRLDDVWRGDFG